MSECRDVKVVEMSCQEQATSNLSKMLHGICFSPKQIPYESMSSERRQIIVDEIQHDNETEKSHEILLK